MKKITGNFLGSAAMAVALLSAPLAGAQQKEQPVQQDNTTYQLSRETVLQGTVVSYTASSTTAPIGAHVTVQTATGVVDVHLGSAKLLEANHFTLAAGDTVRIVGENIADEQGSFFAVRILQKGGQTLLLRSVRGIPLSRAGVRALPVSERAKLAPQGGVQ